MIIVVICSPIFDIIKYRWNLNDLQDKVMGCGTARRGHLICNQAKQIGSNPIRSTKMWSWVRLSLAPPILEKIMKFRLHDFKRNFLVLVIACLLNFAFAFEKLFLVLGCPLSDLVWLIVYFEQRWWLTNKLLKWIGGVFSCFLF